MHAQSNMQVVGQMGHQDCKLKEAETVDDATTCYCLTYIGMIYVYWMLYGLYFPL